MSDRMEQHIFLLTIFSCSEHYTICSSVYWSSTKQTLLWSQNSNFFPS